MKLVELHVGQFGSRCRGKGDAVAGGYRGICGVRVDLACSTRSNEDSAGDDAMERAMPDVLFRVGIRKIGAGNPACFDNEARDHGPLSKADALLLARVGDERTANLGSSSVAARVEDAREGVSAFSGAEQLACFGIKARTPLDELGHADGTFSDERFGGGTVDKAVARLDGVFKMESYVLIALGGDGDAALGIVGV
jgi:hypothetical protein